MRSSGTVAALALTFLTLVAATALAVDQPLPGTKLLVREVNGRGKLSVSAKQTAIVTPTPGGSDDPLTFGGNLRVYNPNSGESATFDMPASNWTRNTTGTIFKFKNVFAPNPPSEVKVSTIKGGRQLKVSARSTGITLDEPTQGSIGLVLTVGSRRYCLLFGGAIYRDQPGRFSSRNAPAPASCPPAGPTTSTTLGGTTTTIVGSSTSTTIGGPTTTVSTTSSTTTTITLAECPPPANPTLGRTIFTTGQGSPSCGDPGLFPNGPTGSFSGEVTDGDGNHLADLGLGCLYTGGSFAAVLPPFGLPDGGSSFLDVASINGSALTLTGSPGTGPENCTLGSGPLKHCLNGSIGTNGSGLCASDVDCGNPPGSCEEDANCFFGPPVPISAGAFSTCVVNAIRHDLCGAADLAANSTTVSAGLAPRLYVTGDPGSPCPTCPTNGGTCSAGARSGLPCTGGVGSKLTTIECPPRDTQFAGRLELIIPELSSGTSTMTDPDGHFCPGQKHDGAFGILTGTPATIVENGSPLASNPGMIFDTTLAGTFCVPASGNSIINANADLPGPGALSAVGTLTVCLLPDVCNALCNPCNLGPLCATICSPCVLCLP